MTRLSLWLWMTIWSLTLGGCALPQHAERYYFEKDGAVIATASRYAGRPDNPVDELWIDLNKAPALEIRMPDGVWVGSRETTLPTLARHGLKVTADDPITRAVWHPPFTVGALVGRHQYMSFRHGGAELTLGACGWSFPEVLRTANGERVFGFPMRLKDLEALLGPPARVERIAIVTGFSCF